MIPTPPPIWGYVTQFHHWFQTHQLEAYAGLGALFAAGLVVKTLKRRGHPDLTTHGSARWATARDMRKAGLSRSHGVVLGVRDGDVWMDDKETHTLLLAPTGCHAPGTEVLMSDGHVKAVEAIRVGETVMGPDSMPRTVTALHRGMSDMARIVPVKGAPFVVNLDHILAIKRTQDGTGFAGQSTTISVREWLRTSKTFQHVHKLYRVPTTFPAGGVLPIPPYVLGALLGDGTLSRTPRLTKPDQELRETVAALIKPLGMKIGKVSLMTSGCPAYGLCMEHRSSHGNASNPLGDALAHLGLLHKAAGGKYIPHVYKVASEKERLAILAGILDTDGSLSGGGYDYISKSRQLSADVCFIARSVGLAAYLTPCEKYSQLGTGGTYFRVSISGDCDRIPCQISRKQAPGRRQSKSVLLTGFAVEPAEHGEYYGFTCDGDHLYVMGDFTVTHNSGKDTFHLNPTLDWGWTASTLNLDCQNGEMYDATHAIRKMYGGVEAFAPYRSPMFCINVCDSVRLGQPEEFRDAMAIGRSLTAPEKMRQESSAGAHFRELAAVTIAATLLHVGYATGHTSLAAVWHFLAQHGSFQDTLKEMATTQHTSHGVHQAIAEMSGLLGKMGGGDELSSAWSTTLRPLLLYLDPYVAASTDHSTLDVSALQYGQVRPLSLYLLAESSSTLATMFQVYRVVLDTLFDCLMRHKPNTYQHRLLFVANELPSYGYMQGINKNAATMRKYGIKGLYVAQDLKQLEEVYGQEPDIWANTDCKIFHATGNDRTAKRVTEGYLGKETVEYLVASQQGRGRRSVSPHRVGRPLLTPDEFGQLDPAQLLVLLRGQRPIRMQKYGYDRRYVAA